ncbi:MAG: diaminopimelate epimerase [Polyangiaceae bacterium]
MRLLRFEKWEGLGNDFLVVAADPDRLPNEAEIRWLCDRRRGVGGDGVLFVGQTASERPRMVVRNADGSRPEMCGNGVRCVAAWLRPGGGELLIETDAGGRRCVVERQGQGWEVAVDMGRRFGEEITHPAAPGLRFQQVDMGNPHAVSLGQEPDLLPSLDRSEVSWRSLKGLDELLDRVGPALSAAPPSGCNVELCRITGAGPQPSRIDVLVWERGVGRTQACGTGACAVAAAACRAGRARWGEPLVVGLPGGDLTITVAAGGEAVTMRGPARRAFEGEVAVP